MLPLLGGLILHSHFTYSFAIPSSNGTRLVVSYYYSNGYQACLQLYPECSSQSLQTYLLFHLCVHEQVLVKYYTSSWTHKWIARVYKLSEEHFRVQLYNFVNMLTPPRVISSIPNMVCNSHDKFHCHNDIWVFSVQSALTSVGNCAGRLHCIQQE